MLTLFLKQLSGVLSVNSSLFRPPRARRNLRPFSTHQDTRIGILCSIDVVWIQGVRKGRTQQGWETMIGTRERGETGWRGSPENGSSKSTFLSTPSRFPFSSPHPLKPPPFLAHPLPVCVPSPIPTPRVLLPSSSPSRIFPLSSLLPLRTYPSTCFPPFLPGATAILPGTLANHPSYPNPSGYLHTPLTGLRMFSALYVSGICERAKWTRLSDP